MKQLKIYQIYFEPMYPVPYGLIILAKDKRQAMSIAMKNITHTKPTEAILIDTDEPKVIFYESGDY